MTSSFDFILLPLARQKNVDLPELPGFKAARAPRRAARGRSSDTLVVHLAISGTAPLSPKGYERLLDYLVDLYYKSAGSVTTAMRSVAEWLNNYLIERNRRGERRSMHSVGHLTIAVFKGNRLYIAQCGPTHTYLISSQGFTHFREINLSRPGLGLGRVTNIRYNQHEIFDRDLILISQEPPSAWSPETLNQMHASSLADVHRRLLHQVGADLRAALVQVKVGSGNVRILRPEAIIRNEESPSNLDSKLTSGSEADILRSGQSKKRQPGRSRPESSPLTITDYPISPKESPIVENPPQSDLQSPVVMDTGVDSQPSVHRIKEKRASVIGSTILRIGQALIETIRQTAKSLGKFLASMLPDESFLTLPASVMAFVAVVIPIVVVAVAATVYIQRGQGRKYEEHYLKAQLMAEQALQLSEPNDLRDSWRSVLAHLDEAESYLTTKDSQSMRNYALTVLDNLDLVVRVPFQSALVDSLANDAVITRIVATDDDNELYLLNSTDGHVLRAIRTNQGYELDHDFVCEPVPEPLIVGKLVDIIPMPVDDPNNAKILGMDGNGNLLHCIPGGKSPLIFQMPSPDMNWEVPTAFVMDGAGLYVLDPLTNGVWIFWLNDEYQDQPTLFFDDQIPQMSDVIDLTLHRDNLYLLHDDGHLTTCTFGAPTWCEEEAIYKDIREGGVSGPRFDNASFQEIQFAPPPDPSLFLLEPETPAIYHFSVRLTYQRQYQSKSPLPEGPATAFSISPYHQVFIAIRNQVFFGPIP